MTRTSVVSAGYVPMDVVSYRGRVWHAAGGTAGNVAAILSFLGWSGSVAADLGADLAGLRVRRDLQKANVDVDLLRLLPGHFTPRLVHEIDSPAHSYLFRCPTCRRKLPRSRPLPIARAQEILEAVAAPDVFFFDRLNVGTLYLAKAFKSQGSRVFFEPSRSAAPDLMDGAVSVADVIKYADDRPGAMDNAYMPSRGQAVVVTHGQFGARFRVGSSAWHKTLAFSFPVVDSGGAGDWTSAGLLHGIATERLTVARVGEALRWGQALAAVSCGAPGARGLARVSSAEAVLQVAQFVHKNEAAAEVAPNAAPRRSARKPPGACAWCLLPDEVTDRTASKMPSAV